MQLTQHTDYSLRVLIFLALQKEGERVTIDDITKRFNIVKNHLIKVVHKLSKHGYIKTVRGNKGGICLAKPARQINISDIVKTMEANTEIVHCQKPFCPLNKECELKEILDEAQAAFFTTLEKYTLADVSQQPNNIIRLLTLV